MTSYVDQRYFCSPLPVVSSLALTTGNKEISHTHTSYVRIQIATNIFTGVFPGGGGAIYLPKLIGRGLAFEYIFSGQDIDATTAQEFGWINRAFKTSQQLHTFVWSLAKRIALFPDAGRTAAKRVINENSGPTFAQFQSMHDQFFAAAAGKGYTELEPRFMELTANQTRGKGELDLGEELLKMYE